MNLDSLHRENTIGDIDEIGGLSENLETKVQNAEK